MDFIKEHEEIRNDLVDLIKKKHSKQYDIINVLYEHSKYMSEQHFVKNNELERVTTIIFSKGVVEIQAIYSCIVSGFAQESGALLRCLIEIIELLVYIRLDNKRLDELFNGKLPSAGKIAKTIEGNFKDLRKYLNDNASHFSMSSHALRHIFNIEDDKIVLSITDIEKVAINENLNLVILFWYSLIREYVLVLSNEVVFDDAMIRDLDNIGEYIKK